MNRRTLTVIAILFLTTSCLDKEKVLFIKTNKKDFGHSFCKGIRTGRSEIKISDYDCEKISHCMLEKLYDSGKKDYYLEQINVSLQDNSIIQSEWFVDIVLPCAEPIIPDLFSQTLGFNYEEIASYYNPNDIIGDQNYSSVRLKDYMGVLGLKLSFGDNAEQHFIFDTGASNIIINKEFKNILIKKGVTSQNNFIGYMDVTLANGDVVEAELINLDYVYIGDYKVKNVKACVIDGAMMLCGMGLLKKFKQWEFDSNSKDLTLYKN